MTNTTANKIVLSASLNKYGFCFILWTLLYVILIARKERVAYQSR